MQDIFDQLLTYAKGIWIRKWIVILVAWLVCIVGWPVVMKLPDTFESSAQVYVDTDSLLKPLLKGIALETNPQQQVALMVRTLLSRPNLEKIARLTDLDLKAQTPEQFDRLLEDLKSEIAIKSASTEKRGRNQNQNLFTFSYSSYDPILAKNVVQSTLSTLVENTLGDKREDSDSAHEFLDRQIDEYEQRLVEAENQLKEFKRRNIGVMPGEQGDYYSRLERTKLALRDVELQLKESDIRYQSLNNQLKEERDAADSLTYNQADSNIKTSYDSRIEQMEGDLDQLKLKYTDRHPDIRETTRVLEDLVEKRKQELERIITEIKTTGVNRTVGYQELKFATAEAQAATRSLRVRADSHKARLLELEQKIHTIPEIEAELTALNRDYEITLEKYNELISRRESVQLSQSAEVTSDSFQFRVVEPPRVPSKATGPKRILLHSAVLAGGLVIGLGLAFLLGQARPVFFSSRQLNQITGLTVLGSVSKLHSVEVISRTRRNGFLFVFFGVSLVGLYGVILGLQINPALNQKLINHIPDISGAVSPYIDPILLKLKSML
ncbi:MAG: XrtA system polysaccharide chain length determinant [Motiliproteus sp.]